MFLCLPTTTAYQQQSSLTRFLVFAGQRSSIISYIIEILHLKQTNYYFLINAKCVTLTIYRAWWLKHWLHNFRYQMSSYQLFLHKTSRDFSWHLASQEPQKVCHYCRRCNNNSKTITYRRILVEEHSTFSAHLPDRSTLAPPLGGSPYCRKKTMCHQRRNCSHFSCRTEAFQGPHMAPRCILQKINWNWMRNKYINKHLNYINGSALWNLPFLYHWLKTRTR